MVQLHILNGDSIVPHFTQSGLSGEYLVWREMLVEGPSPKTVASPEFWDLRSGFFEKRLGVSREEYLQSFQPEMEKLQSQSWGEITLWFEYDLFCQINMLAAIQATWPLIDKGAEIHLICVGDWPGKDQKVGLGELTPTDFPILMDQRKKLNLEDLTFANEVWHAWCDPDPRKLQPFSEKEHSNFEYLAPSLKAHFRRFPYTTDGITEIEREILKIIDRSGQTRKRVVGELLHWQDWYGFGDLQYKHILDDLGDLYAQAEEELYVNGAGRKVLDGKAPYFMHRSSPVFMGGANKWDYKYDPETGDLVPHRE